MTEDPVKLYVVVMAILVIVLGAVANMSYTDASNFEQAIESAPQDAERFRALSASVTGLINQLKRSKLAEVSYIALVENAANQNLRGNRRVRTDEGRIRGQPGKEMRWKVDINRSSGGPVSRTDVAKFCRQVELDSRGILKVIEVELRRHHGQDSPKPGAMEQITNDRYTGSVVVGMRVVE